MVHDEAAAAADDIDGDDGDDDDDGDNDDDGDDDDGDDDDGDDDDDDSAADDNGYDCGDEQDGRGPQCGGDRRKHSRFNTLQNAEKEGKSSLVQPFQKAIICCLSRNIFWCNPSQS